MTSTGIDIETIVSYCSEAMYETRYELIASFVFLVGWLLGRRGWLLGKIQKPQHTKHKLKYISTKGGHASQRQPQRNLSANPVRLNDPSWLVPKVCQLCQTQVPQAILLYRAALKAGLTLTDVHAEDCQQLFVALVTATIRTGKVDEAMKLLAELRQSGVGVSTHLLASAVKLCTSRHLYAESLAVFESADMSYMLVDKSIWSCLLFCALEAKAYHKCAVFFESVKACGTPTTKDFGNMLRLAAIQRDWERSLILIQEMHEGHVEIESVQFNTTLATCVCAGKVDQACALLDAMESGAGVADVITFNTLMKGYAKAGQIDDCFKVFDRIHASNLTPSQVSYGILLDGCINANKVHQAKQVVENMTAAGCPMNVVLYTTLIKGFSRAGELQQAMEMYRNMIAEPDISPDLITFSVLIKANCDSDKFEEALRLLEEMIELGLKPDEVVFNNLIAGCARLGNVVLGRQLYNDMVQSGIRPSNATFSILIRLHHRPHTPAGQARIPDMMWQMQNEKLLEEAIVMLKEEPPKHNVEPEPRLFLQLIQSCIRDRQGKHAIETYGMLCKRSKPSVSTHSSILNTCMRFNMHDTAAEILSLAAATRARVDACDTKSLVEAAFRKGKMSVVRSCISSMRALGHTIDRQIVSAAEADA